MTKPKQKWWGEEHGRLPKRGKIVGRADLASYFGVTPAAINKWQWLGCPVLKKGSRGVADQFDLADVGWWRIDYLVRQKTGDVGNDDLKARKLKAETELKEAAVHRTASQLIPVATFLKTLNATFAAVRESLAPIADEVAPLVAPETNVLACHRVIERALNNARRRLVSSEALKSLRKRLREGK